MSKEIHPTQQAYADGLKYGKELCAIPWRKPSERPEQNRTLIVLVRAWSGGRFPYLCYEATFTPDGDLFLAFEDESMPLEDCVCWLYADELPLPEWVQK